MYAHVLNEFSYQDLQTPELSLYDLGCRTSMQQSLTEGTLKENFSQCSDDGKHSTAVGNIQCRSYC